jgi:hypothetical protein
MRFWRKRWSRFVPHAVVLMLLLLVFSWYARPDFLVLLANQIWACF